jgi:putative transposase
MGQGFGCSAAHATCCLGCPHHILHIDDRCSCRTLRRLSEPSHELRDRRSQATCGRIHLQALTPQEKQAIVQVCNTPENASLPPSQIVPRLADLGQYLASESSFYRVLKEHGQVNRRGKAHGV